MTWIFYLAHYIAITSLKLILPSSFKITSFGASTETNFDSWPIWGYPIIKIQLLLGLCIIILW